MRNFIKYLTYICLFFLIFLPVPRVHAQDAIGCGEGLGPIADFICNLNPGDSQAGEKVGERLNSVISGIVGFLTIVAALWFLIQFILAGFNWISAGGDKHNIEMARNKMANSLIGILVVVAAVVIVGLLGKILGLNILDPGALIQTISDSF